jgi:hypothetical protein
LLIFTHALHGARLRCNRRLEDLPLVLGNLDEDLCLDLQFADAAPKHAWSLPWAPPGLDCRIEPTPKLTLHVISSTAESETIGLLCSTLLPSMLSSTGALVLRGAAVLGPEGALLLIGGAMAGKSTAAAALASQGLPVISDDVLVLRLVDGKVQVAEGPRWIKLWPDGAALGKALGAPLGPVRAGLGKQRYRCPEVPRPADASANDDPHTRQVRVARVCLLNPSDVQAATASPIGSTPLLAALSDFQRSPIAPMTIGAKVAQFQTLCALSRLPRPLVVQRPSELPLRADYAAHLHNLLDEGGA